MKSFITRIFKNYAPLIIGLAFFAACTNPPDYPIIPEIEFISISKDTMIRGSFFNDTTFIRFSFTDGDGDIGDGDSLQLFLVDSRNGFVNDFRIPFVPELGASNGIKGEITVRVFTSCCIFPPELFLDGCNDEYAQMPFDEYYYDIFIKDRAGNESNVIQTTPIHITCFD